MYSLYSFLLVTWVLLLSPVFLYRAWRYGKYLPGLPERFGRLPESLRFDGRPTIWFHSCSVGETLSVQTLAHDLHELFPEARLVFSTITKTGQAIAKQRFAKYGEGCTFYFPLDLSSIANRILDWIRPSLLVIIDTEIWPNVLREAKRRGVTVVMANGRVSAQSFRFYRWARPVLHQVFRNYSLLMVKSEEDAARIRQMGADPGKVLVSGNIKYDRDVVEKDVSETVALSLERDLALGSAPGHLIVAGSTHPGEELVLMDVLRRVRSRTGLEQTRMMLVPRHPERFGAVAELAAGSGFRVKRRSDSSSPAQGAEIIVLDTLGELATAYRFAAIAFVGGTLIPHGGQSVLEPALYAKPIVTGPSMENFPQIIDDFRAHRAVLQIQSSDVDKEAQAKELAEVFISLLEDESARATLGRAAQSVLEGSKGAARFTVERLAGFYRACTIGNKTASHA
jgi:3-deoxy-D-manno-octulosonic-acid transferase